MSEFQNKMVIKNLKRDLNDKKSYSKIDEGLYIKVHQTKFELYCYTPSIIDIRQNSSFPKVNSQQF